MTAALLAPLHAAAFARLSAIGGLNAYEGMPPADRDLPRVDGYPDVIAPYAVLRTRAGRAGNVDGSGEPVTLGGDMDALAGGFAVVVGAGLYGSCLWAVDKVRGAFTRNGPLVVPGMIAGQVTEDTDPGEPRQDRTITPHPYIVVMQFTAPTDRGV